MIRDLLYAVSRVNRVIGSNTASIVVYASVRTEVLHEVNRVGPEVCRDVDDFGVKVNWNVKGDVENQPILKIIEAKIHASEFEADELPTENVWQSYFPSHMYGNNFKQHLLDISMFKPRNLVSFLSLAREYDPDAVIVEFDAMDQTQIEFSSLVWREMEEELLGIYKPVDVSAIKAVLTGFQARFSVGELDKRVNQLGQVDVSVRNSLGSRESAGRLLKDLYRIGAVGNQYFVKGGFRKEARDRWVFRDMPEPALERDFVVHESLRKVLQLSFVDR